MGPVYVGRPAGAWAHKPRFDDIKDLEKRVVDRGNGKGRIAEAGKSSAVWGVSALRRVQRPERQQKRAERAQPWILQKERMSSCNWEVSGGF